MTLKTTILFESPQQAIVGQIAAKLHCATRIWIVSGFVTVEGVRLLEPSLLANPSAIQAVVVGAGTYQAYEGLDRLIAGGIAQNRLFVNLGHTRTTGNTARHRFYRYHPMLHSKIYYAEYPDGTAAAFIGSHNVTGFALAGLNGEAAVLVEGPASSPEFQKVKDHIQSAMNQSVVYTPGMKQAYSWWNHQFILGLADKANDTPKEGDAKKTIVILAQSNGPVLPTKDEVIYFELPAALGTVASLRAEVHIYLFDVLPPTPAAALAGLSSAKRSLWCRTHGLEMEGGGVELEADWLISHPHHPVIARTARPFRPKRAAGHQQVRVQARNEIFADFEYLFELPDDRWVPVLDRTVSLQAPDYAPILAIEGRRPNAEHFDWYPVTALEREEKTDSQYTEALASLSPDAGSYLLMSLRRRERTHRKDDSETEN